MQAALMIRSKKRVARRKRLRKLGHLYDLPSNVSVKQLQPFPQFPPEQWVGDLDTSIKCAKGKAAWLERGRRCSVQENAASCHRRWVKRNRIHDSSIGGSSDDDDFLGVLRGPSSFANAFLYVGLGTVAVGLVISFVGTGEKGFKTVELRLIGPSLIGIGLVCCILRILFCICPSHCIASNRKKINKKNNRVDADHTTALLHSDNKRVQISRENQINHGPIRLKPKPKGETIDDGMEAWRHIATTSLFMQDEQHKLTNTIVSEEQKSSTELELRDICDSDDVLYNNENIITCSSLDVRKSNGVELFSTTSEDGKDIFKPPNKLFRTRAPANQAKQTKDQVFSHIDKVSQSVPSSIVESLPLFRMTLPVESTSDAIITSISENKDACSTQSTTATAATLPIATEPELLLSPAKLCQ